jgi:hypothetical protein
MKATKEKGYYMSASNLRNPQVGTFKVFDQDTGSGFHGYLCKVSPAIATTTGHKQYLRYGETVYKQS